MKTIKRKSIGTHFSMCAQPAFIGTNNDDGTYNLPPLHGSALQIKKADDYLLIMSMFGTRRTKQNVIRTGVLSINLVSTDMLALMDDWGTHRAEDGRKKGISCAVGKRQVVDVPALNASRWI
ncbi:MAG: hypothetical protein E7324_06035 [Clostridiales bacterium]|nr:hypothetical protein [Clostridiales bacterium]